LTTNIYKAWEQRRSTRWQ